MPKYFLIKGLNHGFYVDFVLIILMCEMYHLNLRVQIDFVLVMLELKPVHRCDHHTEFFHLNGGSSDIMLLLPCFNLVLCFPCCFMYLVFFILDERKFCSFISVFTVVQVITSMDELTRNKYHVDLEHKPDISTIYPLTLF